MIESGELKSTGRRAHLVQGCRRAGLSRPSIVRGGSRLGLGVYCLGLSLSFFAACTESLDCRDTATCVEPAEEVGDTVDDDTTTTAGQSDAGGSSDPNIPSVDPVEVDLVPGMGTPTSPGDSGAGVMTGDGGMAGVESAGDGGLTTGAESDASVPTGDAGEPTGGDSDAGSTPVDPPPADCPTAVFGVALFGESCFGP